MGSQVHLWKKREEVLEDKKLEYNVDYKIPGSLGGQNKPSSIVGTIRSIRVRESIQKRLGTTCAPVAHLVICSEYMGIREKKMRFFGATLDRKKKGKKKKTCVLGLVVKKLENCCRRNSLRIDQGDLLPQLVIIIVNHSITRSPIIANKEIHELWFE